MPKERPGKYKSLVDFSPLSPSPAKGKGKRRISDGASDKAAKPKKNPAAAASVRAAALVAPAIHIAPGSVAQSAGAALASSDVAKLQELSLKFLEIASLRNTAAEASLAQAEKAWTERAAAQDATIRELKARLAEFKKNPEAASAPTSKAIQASQTYKDLAAKYADLEAKAAKAEAALQAARGKPGAVSAGKLDRSDIYKIVTGLTMQQDPTAPTRKLFKCSVPIAAGQSVPGSASSSQLTFTLEILPLSSLGEEFVAASGTGPDTDVAIEYVPTVPGNILGMLPEFLRDPIAFEGNQACLFFQKILEAASGGAQQTEGEETAAASRKSTPGSNAWAKYAGRTSTASVAKSPAQSRPSTGAAASTPGATPKIGTASLPGSRQSAGGKVGRRSSVGSTKDGLRIYLPTPTK